MDWITVIIVGFVLAAVMNLLIEVVYFTRVGICYVLARFIKRKIHILEKCSLQGAFEEKLKI